MYSSLYTPKACKNNQETWEKPSTRCINLGDTSPMLPLGRLEVSSLVIGLYHPGNSTVIWGCRVEVCTRLLTIRQYWMREWKGLLTLARPFRSFSSMTTKHCVTFAPISSISSTAAFMVPEKKKRKKTCSYPQYMYNDNNNDVLFSVPFFLRSIRPIT